MRSSWEYKKLHRIILSKTRCLASFPPHPTPVCAVITPMLLGRLNNEDDNLPNALNIPRPQCRLGEAGLEKVFQRKDRVFFSSYRVHCSSEVHNHCPSLRSTQRLSVIGAGSRERSTLLRWGGRRSQGIRQTNHQQMRGGEPPHQTCSLVLEKVPSPSRHILRSLDLDELSQAFPTLQVQELG